MAYHPTVDEADLPSTETPDASPVSDLDTAEPDFAPIVVTGEDDNPLTLVDERLDDVETNPSLAEEDLETELAPTIDLDATAPLEDETDAELIPDDNVVLVPIEAELPVSDGTDYAE